MGGNEGRSEPGRPLPNGILPGSIMIALDTERWLKAEERTAQLMACIQPNQQSEERRNAVADYVQRLIMKCFPCQVCTCGSVPLKTYLPDGDIDLVAFSHDQILKDAWADQVCDMLYNQEKNENAEFYVMEVQYIQEEVKIIKCLVENIVVDISFNQVGGLCTLCFLDEVDKLIGQNHLFKRSIIFIKAWCYYESRILGAHHELMSTYALDTLVLYIFHVFNNSFHGPLEVLYRFLEFFSNFDWDNFCVSLWGPVPISSLPDVTVESPRKDGGELLLSKLFLDNCSSVYAVFPGGQENNGQPFVSRHFNVVDPLRVNNNLGRSVSKVNFFRIRSAFAFGAKRLARLLECPKESLVYEVNQFFMNTWERHGSGHRPDVPGADSWRLKLSNPDGFHYFEKSKNLLGRKRINEKSFIETEMQGHARGVSHENFKVSSSVMPTSELSAASLTQSLKNQFNLNCMRGADRIGRGPTFDQAVINIKPQKDLKADHLINDGYDHSEDFNSSTSLRGETVKDTSDEQKSDILNSDFASHWQNLQVGRFCQNPRYHGPLVYPSPVMVPPVYLQGQCPYDNTGKMQSTNTNISSKLMTSYAHRLVPVAPLQTVSSRPPHVYQRYMDDMPRYRSGTGTYLPNPKLSVRERHPSGTRRGNYIHDRNDNYGDREGNWNANSKSRAATRSHDRSQADKSNTRTGRLDPSESRADRSRNTYWHVSTPSYQPHNGPLHSNSSQNGPHMAYSMHPMSPMNPDGISNGPSVPPVVMMYPFDHNASYSSHVEPLEFGSLGSVAFPGINEQLQLNEGSRARMDNRLNGGPEHRSSPEQTSTPHHHRKI